MSKVIVEHNEDTVRKHMKAQVMMANRLLIEDIHRVANRTTPMDKSNLRRNVLKTVDGLDGIIEWQEPYASYQERGRRKYAPYHVVKHYTTPGTSAGFAKRAVREGVTPSNIRRYLGQ